MTRCVTCAPLRGGATPHERQVFNMAIYSNNASICSGAKGGSAVASSAYQSADKLKDFQDGLTKDYGRKERVLTNGITKPDNAPDWCLDREQLWNEVQKVEGVRGQYARKHHLALPRELSLEQQEQLVKEYCSAFSAQGMVCDWAIHNDENNHNPHAHIMTTMRPFNKDGSWGQKSKNVAVKDKNGKPVIEGTYANGRKKYKHKCVKMTNWDSKKTLAKWREDWEKLTNDALEKAGSDARVSAKSYKDQGKDYLVPTEHLGPAVSALEKRGIKTDRGNYNRAVKKYNEEVLKYISDTNDLEKNIINAEVKYYGESRNELNAVITKNVRENQNGQNGGISLLNNSRFVNLQNLSERSMDTERKVQNEKGTGDNQSYLSQPAWCYTRNGIKQSDERQADARNERTGDNQRLQSVSADTDKTITFCTLQDLNHEQRMALSKCVKPMLNGLEKYYSSRFKDKKFNFASDFAKNAVFAKTKDNSFVMLNINRDTAISNGLLGKGGSPKSFTVGQLKEIGKNIKGVGKAISNLFDKKVTSSQHLSKVKDKVLDIFKTPPKAVYEIISNPITGILKLPVNIFKMISNAIQASIHALGAVAKGGGGGGGRNPSRWPKDKFPINWDALSDVEKERLIAKIEEEELERTLSSDIGATVMNAPPPRFYEEEVEGKVRSRSLFS